MFSGPLTILVSDGHFGVTMCPLQILIIIITIIIIVIIIIIIIIICELPYSTQSFGERFLDFINSCACYNECNACSV